MGKLVNIATALHESSSREYLPRMVDDKAYCMTIAKQYEKDYWDGDRRYGYGGYSYMPGRWKPVAEALIQKYRLTNKSSVLDVGCGKGFLLFEMLKIEPNLIIQGFDISDYALKRVKKLKNLKAFNHNIFFLTNSLNFFY